MKKALFRNKPLAFSILLHFLLFCALFIAPRSIQDTPRVMTVSLMPPAMEEAPSSGKSATPKAEPEKQEPEAKPKPPAPKETPKPAEAEPKKPLPKPAPEKKPAAPDKKPATPAKDSKPAKTKADTIAERLKQGKTVEIDKGDKSSGTSSVADKLADLRRNSASSSSSSSSRTGGTISNGAALTGDSRSYAEEVVRPFIQQNWKQPTKGELDIASPSHVEISFTVYAGGSVSNARITKNSNSRVLNDSVRRFLGTLRQLKPISAIGSKEKALAITVTMGLN